MGFETELEYETIQPGCLWRLTKPLSYSWHDGVKKHRIIVPAGYVTDFLSLPLLSRAIFTKDGAGKWASVIHDYCFAALHDRYTLKQANKIFKYALRDDPEKVTYFTQWLFYKAVQLGGETYWSKRIANRVALQRELGLV